MSNQYFTKNTISARFSPSEIKAINEGYQTLTGTTDAPASQKDFIDKMMQRIYTLSADVESLSKQLSEVSQPPVDQEALSKQTELLEVLKVNSIDEAVDTVNNLYSKLESSGELKPIIDDILHTTNTQTLAEASGKIKVLQKTADENDGIDFDQLTSELEAYENVYTDIIGSLSPTMLAELKEQYSETNRFTVTLKDVFAYLLEKLSQKEVQYETIVTEQESSKTRQDNSRTLTLDTWPYSLAEEYREAINKFNSRQIESAQDLIINYVFLPYMETGKVPLKVVTKEVQAFKNHVYNNIEDYE